jgi:hypothetical protein
VRQPFEDPRHRLAGISQLPPHQHHQTKSEEQKCQAAQAILNPDHFVVGGENVFTPKSKLVVLVMLMSRVVRVRFVMGANGRRSIHFRRKLRWLISEEKASLQSDKFQIKREKRPVISGSQCAKFVRAG